MTTLRQFIDTVRQKISGLDYAADAYLNYANSVTGASDTNVGDAIMSLAAGYGQGGGGGEGLELLYSGVINISSAQTAHNTAFMTFDCGIQNNGGLLLLADFGAPDGAPMRRCTQFVGHSNTSSFTSELQRAYVVSQSGTILAVNSYGIYIATIKTGIATVGIRATSSYIMPAGDYPVKIYKINI